MKQKVRLYRKQAARTDGRDTGQLPRLCDLILSLLRGSGFFINPAQFTCHWESISRIQAYTFMP